MMTFLIWLGRVQGALRWLKWLVRGWLGHCPGCGTSDQGDDAIVDTKKRVWCFSCSVKWQAYRE